MRKKAPRKLSLDKETLVQLKTPLRDVVGGSVVHKTVFSGEAVGCAGVTETCQTACDICWA